PGRSACRPGVSGSAASPSPPSCRSDSALGRRRGMLPSWQRAPRLFRPTAPAGDIHHLDGASLGPGELDSLTSPSLFGGSCVVVVRAAQNTPKEVAAELTRYAASPAPDTSLILTHAGG